MRKTGFFIKALDSSRKFKRLFGNSKKQKGLAMGLVVIKKGDSVGIHNTGDREEILVVLQGKAQVNISGKRFMLKDGMMLYIPPNTLHNVGNTYTRLLKYLYVTAAAII